MCVCIRIPLYLQAADRLCSAVVAVAAAAAAVGLSCSLPSMNHSLELVSFVVLLVRGSKLERYTQPD